MLSHTLRGGLIVLLAVQHAEGVQVMGPVDEESAVDEFPPRGDEQGMGSLLEVQMMDYRDEQQMMAPPSVDEENDGDTFLSGNVADESHLGIMYLYYGGSVDEDLAMS